MLLVIYTRLDTATERILSYTCYAARNSNGRQASATLESIIANFSHTVGNLDGGEADASRESPLADRGNTATNGNRSQAAAIVESSPTDGVHVVNRFIIPDSFWDDDIVLISIWFACYFSSLCLAVQVVIDAVNLYGISACQHWQERQNE